MSERSLRGTGLGSNSLESDEGVAPAPTTITEYRCPEGHGTQLPFSVEAEIPVQWECQCGKMALLEGAEEPEGKPVKPPRTHWDMLMERRTVAELEELLDERLALLRSGELFKRSA
ncbi:MAG: electron transporter [Micrococcales bacterium]|nr:MAG: electron transporter [Micrococcales bacterium]PIE27399.1 MAG: electron transporter [Micrococcales bacterium]